MKNIPITISRNDLRKSLPDVACNEAEDAFLAVWSAAPGMESSSADYFISGQKISSSGEALGGPVEVLKTEDILMLPRVLYNPNKNQDEKIARLLKLHADKKERIEKAVAQVMDLTPRGIRDKLDLNRPIYARTSAYGHFGRAPEADGGFSWERTDLVEALKKAV